MENENIWKASFRILKVDWKIWPVLAFSVAADLYAVLTFSQNWVDIGWVNILLLIVAVFSEALLIKMMAADLSSGPHRFRDDLTSVLGSTPRILGTKILIFLLPMVYYAVFLIFSAVITSYDFIQAIFIGLFLPLLLFAEIWNFYACAIILLQNFSATDALSLSLQAIWANKKKIFIRIAPFVLIEAVVIGILILTKSVTSNSTFLFTVTTDMAYKYAAQATSSYKLTVAGNYFVLNRLVNGLVTAMVKINGLDLISSIIYSIRSWVAGLVVVVFTMPLTAVKMAMLTKTYQETAGSSISASQSNWRNKEEILKAGRRV
jgi:hypothetical protein